MRVNINHPSFISFLENISNNILSAIKIDEYFSLTPEKKMAISFTVLSLIKNSARVKAALSDSELKGFIEVLRKKNEQNENYEFAAVLYYIIQNYEIINELSITTKKLVKQPMKKTDISSQQ
jgi:hypothetical protein